MAVQLTPNAIAAIIAGDENAKPLVQIVDIKLIGSQERYRFLISDSVATQHALLATQLNDRVKNGSVKNGSVVQLTDYICTEIRSRKLIVVLGMNAITHDCDIISLQPSLCTQSSNQGNSILPEPISDDSEEKGPDDIEDSNRREKIIGANRKRFKKGKKISMASKLSKQLDELCEAVKDRSSYIRTDPPDCSIQEVLDKLATLPECEPMTPLFKLGIRLFAKKANREIFVALRQPEYQIEWLKDQQIDDLMS